MLALSFRSRAIIAAGLGLLMAACAGVPNAHGPTAVAKWQARKKALQALHDWRLSARVGIVAGENGGSGSVDWRIVGNKVNFRFAGPFGFGGLRITSNGHRWLVQSSQGKPFVTKHLARDLGRQLNLPLPLASLRFWVVGVPDPHAPFKKRIDQQGRLVSLSQEGWQIKYLDYDERARGHPDLPVRLRVRRKKIHIKVAVHQWFLHTSDTAVLRRFRGQAIGRIDMQADFAQNKLLFSRAR